MQSPSRPRDGEVILSEVLAALSFALDLTEGAPPGHSVRACLIGMRLADALQLDEGERSSLYYALLLKDAGCSANAAGTAELFGSDDRAAKRAFKTVNWTRFGEATAYGVRQAGADLGLLSRLAHLARVAVAGQHIARNLVRIRCDRGAEIVSKLGFPSDTADAVRCLDEHWDGRGHPRGLAGDAIPVYARIALLAQTIDVFLQQHDLATALSIVAQRAGTWFDPELARIVRTWRHDDGFWGGLDGDDLIARVVAVEPGGQVRPAGPADLDTVAEGFADVIDAKSPYTARHSLGVASFAVTLAERLGLDAGARRDLRRAGLLHDIGKLAISNRILDRAGPLTADERRAMEAHPVFSWTILSQVTAFAPIAHTAALHHERLDGKGYPWGYTARYLDRAARILQVADVYEALTANRPYRRPLSPDEACRMLRADAGPRLDAETVEALAVSPPVSA